MPDWMTFGYLGNLSSMLGLAVSFIGFGVTLYNVVKTRGAAQSAERAADAARASIRRFNLVSDLSSAVTAMDEIKRLHRTRKWVLLPDRYENLRKLLIAIRASNNNLTEEQSSAIQGVLTHINVIERQIEHALETSEDNAEVTKMNSTLSRQSERLYETLIGLTRG